MAVSQTLTLTEHTVNIEANTSKVHLLWYSQQTGESWNGYERTAKYYVSINGGPETEYSVKYTLPKQANVLIVDTNITVPHKDDGSGTVRVRTWMDTDISAGVIENTKSLTLTTIPRESAIDILYGANMFFTSTITYKYTPKYASFYNRCNISLNIGGEFTAVRSINLGQKPASQQTATVTLTEDELSIIYNKLPNVRKGTLRFTFRTYGDSGYSTQVGSPNYKEVSLSIPDITSTKPTATVMFSPDSDAPFDTSDLSDLYVKGFSRASVKFSDVSAKYGAKIASYKLTVDGKDYIVTDNTAIGISATSKLSTSGNLTVSLTVTDSRGISTQYSERITVLDYTKPSIDLLTSDTNYFDSRIICTYTPANSVFYSSLTVTHATLRIKEIALGQNSAVQNVSYMWLTESERSEIYNKLPNSAKGTLRVTLNTYADSKYIKKIGEVTYKDIELSIPENDETKPTARITTNPVTPLPSPFDTVYIKGKSKVTLDLIDGEGKYGAEIVSYTVKIDGKSFTPPHTSDWLINSGSVNFTATVTDSRGFSRSYYSAIPVIDYSPPQILPVSGENEVIVSRCDSEGELSDTGTYLKIKAKRGYSRVLMGNGRRNYCAIQYRYKESGGSYSAWTTILDRTSVMDDEIVSEPLLGILDIAKSYYVQIRAIDDIGESVIYATTISTEKVYMHRAASKNSFALGKYAEEENSFDVAEDLTAIFRGKVRFPGEAWIALDLYSSVAMSETSVGRYGGSGAFYRVCAGEKHICVIFNVSFTTSSSTVRVVDRYKTGTSVFQIPAVYRPSYDVYALCPVGFADGSRGIATVSVAPSGRVNIYAVHKLPGATLSEGETVDWIDGYIDFWT